MFTFDLQSTYHYRSVCLSVCLSVFRSVSVCLPDILSVAYTYQYWFFLFPSFMFVILQWRPVNHMYISRCRRRIVLSIVHRGGEFDRGRNPLNGPNGHMLIDVSVLLGQLMLQNVGNIFRWVHPSLYEGLSVRRMVRPSDGCLVRR